MRKIWPKGTVLYTRDGAAYTIDSANDTGGSAVIYFASSSRSGVRAVLKEFYPSEGWVRKGGAPVPEKCAGAAWNDPLLQSGVQQLSDFAKQEMDVSQEIASRTMLVWPFREMLQMKKICEPGNGSVWIPADKVGGILPCCILLMDDLNHPDGLWLKDLLREAAFEKSAAHPLGNLQGQDELELAVPPVAAAVDAARCILSLLYRIHHGGYLHGDINLGNIFLLTDHTGGKITNAMTIDFGSARCLVDGKTAPVQKNTLFTTPGFCAPEIEKGKLSDKLLQLTEKADVYSVGKLLRMLLYPEAAAAFREHRSLELWLRGAAFSEWDVYDSAVSPDVLRRLNEILTGAAEEEVDARSSVEEMLEQLDQVHLLLEPPPWQVKLALPELNGSEVIGREADICSIEKELQVHKKLVLHGFSGIGKTKLATLLGHEWQKTYPDTQVYYAFFPGSMTSLVLDALAQNISTVDTMMETKDEKQVPRPGKAIAADVFVELNAHMHPDDLLIIDNVDSDTKSWEELVHEKSPWGKDLFEELCSLQCRVIFVTRMDLKNAEGIAPYPVGKLDGENLRALLRRYSDDAKARSDQELDDLIRLVDYHTMTVAMVSKTMQESELTVPEIYKELEQGEYGSDAFVRIKGEKPGDYEQRKIEGHLICLFRLSNFNEREQALLRCAQLIGEGCGMYEKLFLVCCPHKNREENTANLEALNHLAQMGYIQRKKEDNKESLLNLHTLVRVVAKKVLPVTPEMCETFLQPMEEYCYSWKYPILEKWNFPEGCDRWYIDTIVSESFLSACNGLKSDDFLNAYWKSCAGRTLEHWMCSKKEKEKIISCVVESTEFFEQNHEFFLDMASKFFSRIARFCENMFYLADEMSDLYLYENSAVDWIKRRRQYGKMAVFLYARIDPLDSDSMTSLCHDYFFKERFMNNTDTMHHARMLLDAQSPCHCAGSLIILNFKLADGYDKLGQLEKAEPYYQTCFDLLEELFSEGKGRFIEAEGLKQYCVFLEESHRYQEALNYNLRLEKLASYILLRPLQEQRLRLYYFLRMYDEFIVLDDQLGNPVWFQSYRQRVYTAAIRAAKEDGNMKRMYELKGRRYAVYSKIYS